MGCRCERLMVLSFVIGIWLSGMMNGALAGRHVMEESGPLSSSNNIQHQSLPLSFTCDLIPFLPQCSPPPPSSTTTTP
ncbi:hypothetical protein ACSQ67_024737 [Phaseolus vulgaris]